MRIISYDQRTIYSQRLTKYIYIYQKHKQFALFKQILLSKFTSIITYKSKQHQISNNTSAYILLPKSSYISQITTCAHSQQGHQTTGKRISAHTASRSPNPNNPTTNLTVRTLHKSLFIPTYDSKKVHLFITIQPTHPMVRKPWFADSWYTLDPLQCIWGFHHPKTPALD